MCVCVFAGGDTGKPPQTFWGPYALWKSERLASTDACAGKAWAKQMKDFPVRFAHLVFGPLRPMSDEAHVRDKTWAKQMEDLPRALLTLCLGP